MAYELTYTNLEMPFGKEVSLSGLGVVVKNGEPFVITDEVADQYKNSKGKTVLEGFNKRKAFTVKSIKSTGDEGVS